MPPLADDPWIAANSPIAPEKLHALGVVNFRWQSAEFGLRALLILASGMRTDTAWAIIHNMGDIALSTAIEQIVETSKLPDDLKEAIDYALKIYDINRLNRNQLTHFLPSAIRGSDLSRMRGPSYDPQPIADSLEDIRRVAKDIWELLGYLTGLLNVLAWRLYRSLHPHPMEPMPPLPDRPALPESVWKPPQPDRSKRQSRP